MIRWSASVHVGLNLHIAFNMVSSDLVSTGVMIILL